MERGTGHGKDVLGSWVGRSGEQIGYVADEELISEEPIEIKAKQ